jgi:hypothetical protein
VKRTELAQTAQIGANPPGRVLVCLPESASLSSANTIAQRLSRRQDLAMNVSGTSHKTLVLLLGLVITAATGCVATGPLTAFRSPELDDRELDRDPPKEGRGPIRLVSFDMLPLWPSREEVSEASASVATPFAAGTDAVKRGVGQVQQGFVQFGQGTRRALTTTTNYLSRPLVAIRPTPGEPSLLQRMFSPNSEKEGPRTTREFFEQERLR